VYFVRAASCAAMLCVAAGCASMHKVESVEEGPAAARHAAEAQAQAQAKPGAAPQGSVAPVPSLAPGEGHVQLQAGPAPPATAPAPDKFDNNNPAHLLARCRDRAARKEWFDAVGDCRRSYELDPSSIEPQVELMRLLVTLRDFGDAEESANKVLAARPNDPVALYYLAWSYRGRQEYPRAIATLQRAIALDPKRAEFVQALGITYCQAENYGKGIETLERALAMEPANAMTTDALNSARGLLKENLAPYLKLVQERPDSYDNQAALGFIFQRHGLPQKALAAYDIALSKMPGPLPKQDAETKKLAAQIYYNRGIVYRELGKPADAEPALWQAMQLDPSLAAFAWYYIGLCRYDLGTIDSSIDALRKSVDLAPDVADNRLALADSLEKAGKTADATTQRTTAQAIQARDDAQKEARKKADADAAKPTESKAPSAGAAAQQGTLTPAGVPSAASPSQPAPSAGSEVPAGDVPAQN
jgi:tetratricopeptide (TPR) repeat protein